MAPTRPTKHSRTTLSTKTPQGIYAPSSASPTSTSTTQTPPAHPHTGPSTSLKRKREAILSDYDKADDAFAEFRVNKRDKRSVRRQALLAKVRDGGVRKGKVVKRRRAGRKLRVEMGGLGEALPDAPPSAATAPASSGERDEGEEEGEGVNEDDGEEIMAGLTSLRKATCKRKPSAGEAKMVMKSLRHRPGALKRKRAMEGRERERFGLNLAQLVGQRQQQQQERMSGGVEGSGDVGTGARGVSGAEKWTALRKFIGGTMERSERFGKA